MDWFLDLFGSLGESVGRAVGGIILSVIGIGIVAMGGYYLSHGILWTMRVLHIRNFTIECWLKDNSFGLLWYAGMILLVIFIFL